MIITLFSIKLNPAYELLQKIVEMHKNENTC